MSKKSTIDTIEPIIRTLADEGLSSREIRDCLRNKGIRLSHQGVINRINRMGISEKWDENKKRRKKKKKEERPKKDGPLEKSIERITPLIKDLPIEKRIDKATIMTIKYIISHPRSRHSPMALRELIRIYLTAEEYGSKPTLKGISEEVAEKTGYNLPITTISRIIYAVGKRPFRDFNNRHTLSEREIRAIQSLKLTRLTGQDIAFFLNIPYHQVIKLLTEREWVANPRVPGTHKRLSIRFASNTYRMADEGASIDKIIDSLMADPRVANYAILKRNEIAPLIIDALSRAYEREITTPYLSNYGLRD